MSHTPDRSAGVSPASSAQAASRAEWRSRGYLPHFDAPNVVQHVVFRLADSLPAEAAERI